MLIIYWLQVKTFFNNKNNDMSYSFTVIYLSLGFVFPLFKSSKEWNNVIIYLGGKKKKTKPLHLFFFVQVLYNCLQLLSSKI